MKTKSNVFYLKDYRAKFKEKSAAAKAKEVECIERKQNNDRIIRRLGLKKAD